MGFFKDLIFRNQNKDTTTLRDQELLQWLGIDPKTPQSALSEVTYFTCLKILSESIGKLPVKLYQQTERGRVRAPANEALRLLTVRPNAWMTPSALVMTTEFNSQHYGNGYIAIESNIIRNGKYGGEYHITGLYPLRSDCVTTYVDDAGVIGGDGLIYSYRDPRTGNVSVYRASEIIHIPTWYSRDGIMGEPVRNILRDTIAGASSSQRVMNRLYDQGMTASYALQYTSDLDDDRRRELEKKFANKLTGERAAGRVIPIPRSLTLTPLNTKLTDSQFFELRQYTAIQIAGAFGIRPAQINDLTKSSYASSEAQNVAFLVDTLSPRLKIWEEELNAKLLLPSEVEDEKFFKFNERAILRTDTKTQIDAISTGVQNALYTPNEGREYLDLPAEDGGDILICNGNYIPVTQVGNQYTGGAE